MRPRLHYRFGSAILASTLPLPALPTAPGDEAVSIHIERTSQICPADADWRHHWLDAEEVVLSLAQQGSGYWLRFPGLADFLLQPDAGRILLAADASADDHTLEHLLLDQVLPRFQAHHGQLMVHASAVTLGGCHALFLGPSGWGKSTLAGLLRQNGHTVLSDDCVQLHLINGKYAAIPTYPSLRLYADSLNTLFPGAVNTAPVASYSQKQRVALELPEGALAAVPVDALYILGDPAHAGDGVRISSMRPSLTCQALIAHSFRLDLGEHAGNVAHFTRCAAAVNAVPAFRLDYARDFSQSRSLVDAILQHLSSLPGTA